MTKEIIKNAEVTLNELLDTDRIKMDFIRNKFVIFAYGIRVADFRLQGGKHYVLDYNIPNLDCVGLGVTIDMNIFADLLLIISKMMRKENREKITKILEIAISK